LQFKLDKVIRGKLSNIPPGRIEKYGKTKKKLKKMRLKKGFSPL
jgi:hypothetical protein